MPFAAEAKPSSPAGKVAAEQLADPQWAWARYDPDADRPWNLPLAGHLYRRAAFGGNWGQLQEALADGPQETVDRLVRPGSDVAEFNRTYDGFDADCGSMEALSAWWLRRAISSPHPLLEKMTLFWHNHFAVTNANVKDVRPMCNHVHLLRTHALGQLEPMLLAVSSDPAMLISSDSSANRKSQPTEHYARLLMGQYCLGGDTGKGGNFSETDISEAARAFTGWFVLKNRLRFFDREHDEGVKKILGQQGRFGSEDVVRIVLRHPASPPFLVRKLYRWLISESDEPSDALVAPLAESFAEDYDIGRLVETMLRSNLFFSPAAYRRRIKSPIEFALSIVRPMEELISTTQLVLDLVGLGQNLGYPPTSNGWDGGRSWISRVSLIGRNNLAQSLLAAKKPYSGKLDPTALVTKHNRTDAAQFVVDLYLQGDLDERRQASLPESAGQLRNFTQAVLTLPEFQLA